mmetsp:Transcript_134566/g.335785  ORF Transcript_134566/g.335785 Transcript_134566/m.335785 type:complete len:111 (+) Transcript_134566:162-494(+)
MFPINRADSVVLHPELLRSYRVGPKSQSEYMMEHMGLRPSRRAASVPANRRGRAAPGTAGSRASLAASSSQASSAAGDLIAVKDPYNTVLMNGPPILSVELASHVTLSGR